MRSKKKKENHTEKTIYRYKNKIYKPNVLEDYEKDVYKVTHWIEDVEDSSTRFEADFTPYHTMSKVDFQMYVDLGCPARKGQYPWSTLRLHQYKEETKNKPVESTINKPLVTKDKGKRKNASGKTRNT